MRAPLRTNEPWAYAVAVAAALLLLAYAVYQYGGG